MTQTPDGPQPWRSMAERVAPLWSAEKASSELGLQEEELVSAGRSARLVALETSDHAWVFPVAQFERVDGIVRVRPDVQKMLLELAAVDRWTVAQLLATPADELDGLSPYEAVKAGWGVERLVAFARRLRIELTQ